MTEQEQALQRPSLDGGFEDLPGLAQIRYKLVRVVDTREAGPSVSPKTVISLVIFVLYLLYQISSCN